MFRKNALLRNAFSLFAVFALVMGGLSLVGCAPDGNEFVDDRQLNSRLIGTWEYNYEGGSDVYRVTETTISHITGWGDFTDYSEATIEFVYNFSNTAGCLIIQRHGTADTKYSAVYFKNLTAATVLLGDARDISVIGWDPENPNAADPAVADLETAKDRFKPENAEMWGGGSALVGTPQTRK
ncbi:hypothetical protein AGMMS50255_0350 [Spirochaetia bacterium]|nr:hypothetical protein AGMMS50255_0140 [Spirochaetia bacterium]GHV86739.1 hypothetical protein AGMMS50255_0350 [Spirochaetia bacterium]